MRAIISAQPDVIALQSFDHDLQNAALAAFVDALALRGLTYPFSFAGPSNAGLHTDIDLDGDGKTGGPGDAQGYGRFFGQGGMAILSRYQIDTAGVRDFSAFLWKDLPGSLFPKTRDGPFPSAAAYQIQRLSSHGHWVVPILHPTFGRFNVLTFHAAPPVFDGPEDRNGRRNHDEVAFWRQFLNGSLGKMPTDPFFLVGDANLDPDRGDGRSIAIQQLLADPAIQDPLSGTSTVNWPQTGQMRVDYVLPSQDWVVVDAQVTPQDPKASRHRLVWVEVTRP